MVFTVRADVTAAQAGLASVERGLRTAAASTLVPGANMIIQGAKSVVPVRTGRLRNSIRIMSQTSNSIVGGTDLFYAATVHNGLGFGRNAAPRPFISSQVNIMAPRIFELFLRNVSTIF